MRTTRNEDSGKIKKRFSWGSRVPRPTEFFDGAESPYRVASQIVTANYCIMCSLRCQVARIRAREQSQAKERGFCTRQFRSG